MQNVLVLRRCTVCRDSITISVNRGGYHRWRRGELIQHALPELSEDNRELLISGTCGECFDMMYAVPDE